MVLEATMIIVDNSESSRNGDYVPSRFNAQVDAASMIFEAKSQSNPESSVGLMSMGGDGPEVLTTLTTDMGKIFEGLHRTKIRGTSHLSTGVNIAALALKHRQNKSQRQRIIAFICSHLEEDEKALVKLAKRMKKYNISVDIVVFGETGDEMVKKLEAFNEHVKSGEGSNLLVVPPGPNLLSDTLITSPILAAEAAAVRPDIRGATGDAGEGGTNNFEFGVDPSMDPELALALRMSYEEEKARQERERREREEQEGKTELANIPEADEKQPLLNQEGEPNTSGQDKEQEEGDKKDKEGDPDKMDTA